MDTKDTKQVRRTLNRSVVSFVSFVVIAVAVATLFGAQQPVPSPQTPVFRSSVNLVLVDVVVRDKKGVIVKGLTADDFELYEDGKKQQIVSFAFEQVANSAKP